MKWKKSRIGDLCDIGRGSSPRPISNPIYFEEGDIPWIKIADATRSGKYIHTTKEFVNNYGASFSRKLPVGSLILATSGVSLGQVKLLGVEGCIHDGWLYLHNFYGIDKEFLYYRLLLLNEYFLSQAYGAAIPNINTDILRNVEIKIPQLKTQQKIASILSAYDNLIENNLRRTRLLEESAQLMYKEWFINLRFPGYEHIMVVDGIPEGWKRKKLKDITKLIKRGISPQYVNTNGIKVINQKCIRNHNIDFRYCKVTSKNKKNASEKYLQPFDILINSTGTGTLGRTAQIVSISEKLTVDSHITIVRPEENISPLYLGYAIFSMEKMIESMGSGATNQTELSTKRLEEITILIPNKDLLNAFHENVYEKILLIENIQQQNQKLKQARDILLPRLMDGGIEV